ncbi:MAG: glycosyltransferase [Egibacteraceae bacterium]
MREAEVDEVLFVTTAKEDGEGERSTYPLLQAALAQGAQNAPQLRLLHCTVIGRFRAAQLNLAVHDVRERYCRDGAGASRVWIGVYNADSRPQASTFGELRERAKAEKDTRLYQQLVDYVVPRRPGVSWLATGNAVLQTWWTQGHYWARNSRGSSSLRWWSATSPFSTFGHGEFIRLDLLDEIGGFPDFAYADGLLLGWICRLMGERIGLLASRDRAEVPRTVRDLLVQQHAWLRGLLNFNMTERWARENGRLRLAEPQLILLRYEHLAIPVAWGLSTPVVLAGMAVMIRRFKRSEATVADFTCLLGLATYPVIPAFASAAGYNDKTPWFVRSIAAAASWVVEGLAFWPAAVSHVRKSQTAPAKTPR